MEAVIFIFLVLGHAYIVDRLKKIADKQRRIFELLTINQLQMDEMWRTISRNTPTSPSPKLANLKRDYVERWEE